MQFSAGPDYCGLVRFSTWGPLTIPLTLFVTKETLDGAGRAAMYSLHAGAAL